ncbi:hypothetical protein DVH24_001864 [Malus domestica]|uniref:Uncharacterized protein n=1 Tax=Malus domestica TaxID=3750 RepID=A0A498I4A7_MALDO|nr:hypothetical protein DVH24_001864 [Malus domestica]
MMRERSDPAQKKCIITSLCIVAILLGFLYVYYGSLFSSQSHGASALEYGSRSLRKLGSSCLDEDEDNNKKQDESSTKYGHLELIPYLDINLIYQMRLKFDLS